MEIDPTDPHRAVPPTPPPGDAHGVIGVMERLLIAAGLLFAIAFVSLPLLGPGLALSTALLAAPVVVGFLMRKHLTEKLASTGAVFGLPLAVGLLWVT